MTLVDRTGNRHDVCCALISVINSEKQIFINKHSWWWVKLPARDTLIKVLFIIQRYTRNLVDAGNGRFNLMILCWNEGQSSTVHDHSDSHCFMKVLKGGLTEIKYNWPKEQPDSALISSLEPKCDDGHNEYEQELQEIGRTTMHTNEVCYINGEFWDVITKHYCKLFNDFHR